MTLRHTALAQASAGDPNFPRRWSASSEAMVTRYATSITTGAPAMSRWCWRSFGRFRFSGRALAQVARLHAVLTRIVQA